jgi:glycosyltransferase involved in cell wall biosynthesis
MTPIRHLAFIGNSLPRRCGIATFTTDLQQAVAGSRLKPDTTIVAMTDDGRHYDYPPVVRFQIHDEISEEYAAAATWLNAGQFDGVSLQHEFGIFGGEAGGHIMSLLPRLTVPIVTTLHTILAAPTAAQSRVLRGIVDLSASVIVMAEKGRDLLRAEYGVPAHKIEVIPHGIPDCPFLDPAAAKLRRGFNQRSVILTFGLLSPNKGIEVMIDAMPAILHSRPDAVYVVLGATHPNLVRREGEAYRERLQERVCALGIEDHVVFLDQFVDHATLIEFISMCDVYVTPYLNEAQMTSGTLAYSFGLGKAVVSTPYWHARELLADKRGVLVPFGDPQAIGIAISVLLTDDARRNALREQAYAYSRSMTWERTAERYLGTFEKAQTGQRIRTIARQPAPVTYVAPSAPPQIRLNHFLSMCDDTGLYQHAIHSVPDRSHGYCVDDNARALLVACALNSPGEERLSEVLTARLASFVQHAWNRDARRFRNFMSFDRRWLEDSGSEDSHGRALWALGECARNDASPSRRRWAAGLFAEAVPPVADFRSPRAWAFTLLGLEGYREAFPEEGRFIELQHLLARRLMALLSSVEKRDWVWFEEGLAYDNARLPQALIVTGLCTETAVYVAAGLRSLRWLMEQQTTEAGHFRPVGSQSFGDKRTQPRRFDQQPLEAAATISACLAAWRADGDPEWKSDAAQAFAWFLGSNDLSSPLANVETGSCSDGLHPGRINENRGGESVVSYLLGLAEIREAARSDGNRASFLQQMRALRA